MLKIRNLLVRLLLYTGWKIIIMLMKQDVFFSGLVDAGIALWEILKDTAN